MALGLLLLPVPATAQAASLTVSARDSDFVDEDRPFRVFASGIADGDAHLVVKGRPVDGVPCASAPATDTGTIVIEQDVFDAATGGFGPVSATHTVGDPSAYLLCGWLEKSGLTVSGAFQQVIVREGSQVLEFQFSPWRPFARSGPAKLMLERGVRLDLAAVVNNDLPNRFLFAILSPFTGSACAKSSRGQTGRVLASGVPLKQAGTNPVDTRVPLGRLRFDRGGRRQVCGWVQESPSDTAPEEAFYQRITVPRRKTTTVARIVRVGGVRLFEAASRGGVPLDRGSVNFLTPPDAPVYAPLSLKRLKPQPWCQRGRQLALFRGVPREATFVEFSGARSLRTDDGGVGVLRGARRGRCR